MSCGCDYDPADVWDESRIKARKTHRCGECKGLIQPGEFYLRVGCLFDGRWSTLKRCADCETIACDLRQIDPCYCELWGRMRDDLMQLRCDLEEGEIDPVIGAFNAICKSRGGVGIAV